MSKGTAAGAAYSEPAGKAFGALAASYDRDFETLPASRRLRRLVWNIYFRYFAPGDSLLELNCGTGTDALKLAESGMQVHATDISGRMLDAFREKLIHAPRQDLISMQHLAFDQLGELRGRTFDGCYSNMAGLNCERDLHRVADDLHAIIKPGGFFIGTFLGTLPVWEMLSFLIRGNVRQAFRRRSRSAVRARVADSVVPTYYYSPRRVRELFAPHFAVVEIQGLNILTPPPTSLGAYRRLGRAMRSLERLDDMLIGTVPFSRMGDHFVIVLRHTGGL